MKIRLVLLGVLFLSVMVSCNSSKSSDHGWLTNLEEAAEYAKDENKKILLVFTGSDWCRPCQYLHKDVFESEKFAKFANKNLVLVEMDFPRKAKNKISPEQSKYNNELKRKYKVKGFPTVVIMDNNLKEINRWVGYSPTPLHKTISKYKEAIK